ncbi:MAG TPA: bifunctional phosphopantothenoylcysteine decarboxylase/phosphopantothenate--cysteine ligase CoaBC [Rubrobacteraceae bacterium]|nr:bifunctional phosphopantothenoylcysteine decarboxylase/phosphopantothenate--cysteine ligase CoaBC [Rubrobacteraceae bacterium]
MILCSVGAGQGGLEVPAVCSQLSLAGRRVEVVLEPGARNFLGPAAFAGHAEVVDVPSDGAEVLLFAPATAGTIARLARGLDGGPAIAAYAVGRRPTVIAPDLDAETSQHPAVRENFRLLEDAGVSVVESREGGMAGATELATRTLNTLGGPLSGIRILVSAGGTHEPIDSVRFVGNHSSGKMGVAIARVAARMGAEVTVVAANVEAVEPGTRWVSVETVDELRDAIMDLIGEHDALVMAAAVSDFKPASALKEKIRRSESLSLDFVATDDILKGVRQENPNLFVVGFAATHGDPVPDAREKLGSKGVNLVVGNDISREGIGFGADENEVYVVGPHDERFVPRASKKDVAHAILDELASEMNKEQRI